GALDAEAPGAEGELEFDARGIPGRGQLAAQLGRGPAWAGDRVEEREAEGVEDRRLPGAGGSGDEEDPVLGDGVEVDGLTVAERAEALDDEAMGTHGSDLPVRGLRGLRLRLHGGERGREPLRRVLRRRAAALEAVEVLEHLHIRQDGPRVPGSLRRGRGRVVA